MFRRRVSGTSAFATWIAFGAVLAVSLPAASAATDDLSSMDRQAIESLLQKKASDLFAEKNKDGNPFKRGSYSREFKKADAASYQVTFYQDTILESPLGGNQLKTERYLLTIRKDGGQWKVAGEELKDAYDGLYRGYFSSDDTYRFDGFTFDREGMKVTASTGYLFKLYKAGKPTGFVLTADDLAYDYTPPQDAGYYGLVKQRYMKDHAEDFAFTPEKATVICDPVSCDKLFAEAFKGLTKVGGADAASAPAKVESERGAGRIRKAYDDLRKETSKDLRDSPFGRFEFPPEPGRTYWALIIKKNGAEHFMTIRHDTWQPWEVGVFVTRYGYFFMPYLSTVYGPEFGIPVYAYYSRETRQSQIPPYELEKREDPEGWDYEIDSLKGTVELALDDAEAVSGDIVYGITLKRDLRELPFSISRLRGVEGERKDSKNPKMFINALQDGEGNDLTYVKTGPFSGMIIFPKPVKAGTKLTLKLKFTNHDSIYKLNPTYSLLDRGGWLPFVRFADFIDDFDLTVKVPAKFRALGIGKKVSDAVKDGVQITRWVSSSPVSFPTVIFGDYIDDGPRTKATKKNGTEIPVRVYVDKTSTNALDSSEGAEGGAREIRGSQLRAIAEQAVNALNLYREVYGVDYPFDKLDLVADPLGDFYGQAPASIIYLGFGVFRGEGIVGTVGGTGLSKFNKDVVAHETGHQWWGSSTCNANARNYWFVESLAEFSSALFVENVYGPKKYQEKIADWRRNLLEIEELSNVQNSYTVWAGGDGFRGAASNIYNKGPYAFHVLRETFHQLATMRGEPAQAGEDRFIQLCRMLAQELKGKEIVTRDIQLVAEKAIGGTMDWFFDQWIRGIGMPQYALFYTVRQTEDGKWLVEGKIKQRVVYGKYKDEMPGVYYRGLAPLTFHTHGGKEFKSKPILVQGAETPFKFKIADEPAEVAFNKDGEILAHDTLINRSW